MHGTEDELAVKAKPVKIVKRRGKAVNVNVDTTPSPDLANYMMK